MKWYCFCDENTLPSCLVKGLHLLIFYLEPSSIFFLQGKSFMAVICLLHHCRRPCVIVMEWLSFSYSPICRDWASFPIFLGRVKHHNLLPKTAGINLTGTHPSDHKCSLSCNSICLVQRTFILCLPYKLLTSKALSSSHHLFKQGHGSIFGRVLCFFHCFSMSSLS